MFRWLSAPLACIVVAGNAASAEQVRIDLIERQVTPPPILSNLIAPPPDLGVAGARVALSDIATTGRFLGHEYRLNETIVAPDDDFLAAARAALADGARLLVVKAPPADLLALAVATALTAMVLFVPLSLGLVALLAPGDETVSWVYSAAVFGAPGLAVGAVPACVAALWPAHRYLRHPRHRSPA